MTAEHMKFMVRFVTAIGAVLATGLVLSPAIGAEKPQQKKVVVTSERLPTRVVQTIDLNLASDQGRERLQWRITGAVRSLCGDRGREPLTIELDRRNCRSFAFASAKPQVEAAIARAQYAGRSAGPIVVAAR
ncbi:UrcA family protein [Sphingomonas sp. AX6]|uniref:UrcA family protein n=1 Tax=Sphingomonas sp. AX6 TaxID=2653171 RepID=UPI0012F24C40|nr:UrcA family protein [Sphingomonas sp. AX6]VXC64285.1 hypothetical protein SPHINGOAX6_30252 [Sphingomonas sp. AX6]